MIIGGYIPERTLYLRWRTACRTPLVWEADQGFYMLAQLTFPMYRDRNACSRLTWDALVRDVHARGLT